MCGRSCLRAQRAVETDCEWARVTDRVPEPLDRLAGQRAPGCIRDGAGNDHGERHARLLEDLVDRVERCLRVQRVENGLDDQEIRAALDQRVRGDAVGVSKRLEVDIAVPRIADVG